MKKYQFALSTITLACLAACGGGGSSTTAGSATSTTPVVTPQSVNVPLMISDASSDDWSAINVTINAITFTDSAGNVTANLLSTPWSGNLEQLDNLAEHLSTATLTAGSTYVSANLTISANPGDIGLTVASDPEAGFPEAPGTVIPTSRIVIQGATGAVGSQTVTFSVKFATPFVAPQATSATNPTPAAGTTTTGINVDFDLSHPAFIIGHVPAAGGNTIWAVNFAGPVKHKPVSDLTHLVLRHTYGSVTSVSAANKNLVVERDTGKLSTGGNTFVAVDTGKSATIGLDTTNGTLFYDLDNKANNATIKDFSAANVLAALQQSGEYVRIATRYQQDGSLVATRIYASTTFNKVYVSPEGHVTHVDQTGTKIVVDNADGKPINIAIDPTTNFYFRNPGNASDVTAIGQGQGFVQSHNIVRGFKVKVTPVDATASPMHAASIDIETAPYQGLINNVSATGFSVTSSYPTKTDNYTIPLAYISATTSNGYDPQNPTTAITGFKYWNYAYPSIVTYTTGSTNAVTNFIAATSANGGSAVNFGSAATTYYATAMTYNTWGNASNVNGWSASYVILMPQTFPHTVVASALVAKPSVANNYTFGLNSTNGSKTVTVGVSAVPGSATLVYQVDRSKDDVTVSLQDITSASGLSALTTGLVAGNKVEVTGVPQSDGSISAYMIKYYTGTAAPSK
ncbi:hypothetical protein ACO0K2_01880 [Undibacterium sp. MH2W]|uniref:hypothetical protein n=1 Tax=Undibacterium sp. MH2W TaxID=3413044 RepID=UPI003BEF5215